MFHKYLHSSIPFGVIHTYRCFHESTHGNCLKHKTKEAVIMCQGYTQRVKGLNDTKVSVVQFKCDTDLKVLGCVDSTQSVCLCEKIND